MKITTASRAPGDGILYVFCLGFVSMILGVFFPPILIVSLLVMLASPFAGAFAYRGPCPNCRTPVTMVSTNQKCPACKHRIHRHGTQLVDVT